MLNLKSFVAASAALSLVSGVSASVVAKRNEEPPQPSCSSFTPFVYAGCFADPSNPRGLLYSSGLDTQNMTVEICVAFCKGNDYKYAGLEYYGECFCGASVNGPQIDDTNCVYPCTGDKTETCGGSDILSVYQDKTFPVVDNTVISDYKPMGCYSEGTPGRSLAWRQDQISTSSMTVETCLTACKAGGYSFAGVEYGQECYCGVVLGNGTLPLPDTSCDLACTGNSAEICGGRSALNLYVATDLESSQPCSAAPPSSSSTTTTATTTTTTSSTLSTTTTTTAPTTTTTTVPTTTTTTTTTAPTTTTTTVPTTTTTTTTTAPTTTTTTTVPTTTTTTTVPTTTTTTTAKPTTTTTTSCTTTLATTKPTTITTTTKTTASLCTSTYTVTPTPTCEYKCGNWCSSPLPTFSDSDSCGKAVAACSVQLASCFLHAGFPASLECFKFSSWCSSVSGYCQKSCPGRSCSLDSCKQQNPPSKDGDDGDDDNSSTPTVSTSVYTCPAGPTTKATTTTTAPSKPTTTTTTSTTTSCVPVPTNSNICSQPHNPWKGYTSNSPVGGIELPCLTCNNLKSDYDQGNCFKLYTSSDSSKCPSYPRSGNQVPGQACKDACDTQYKSCVNTYAEGCRNNKRWGDGYDSANQKCKNQWNDCYSTNSQVSVSSSRCGKFNSGW